MSNSAKTDAPPHPHDPLSTLHLKSLIRRHARSTEPDVKAV